MVCLREISRPRQELGLGPLGLLSHTKTDDRGILFTALTHHSAKTCFLDSFIVISQQVFAFCFFNIVNMLSVMQEVKNIRRHLVRISAERRGTPLLLKRPNQQLDQTRKGAPCLDTSERITYLAPAGN